MRVHETCSYEEMSEYCALRMMSAIREKPTARIVLATGHSPRLSYRLLVEGICREEIDASRVHWIKLDEWLGIPDDDPSTCEHFLKAEILDPLRVERERYTGFNPLCEDADIECERIDRLIRELGGIDLMILGIGQNGHLGLNEPADCLSVRAHAVELSEQTKRHEMLSHTKRSAKRGLTLGMGDIFSARRVILLSAGEGKRHPLSVALSGRLTTEIPVSLLQLHPDCECVTDRLIYPI